MGFQFRAVYENGVFRPLELVDLPERQEVTVTVDTNGDGADQVLFILPSDRWQALCEALDAPPRVIPALRKLLTEASVLDGHDASTSSSLPS